MSELRYTLVTDGSSDRCLLPILKWVLEQHLPNRAVQGTWADLRRLASPPTDLALRISAAVDLYPCELLFVHRDAETEPGDARAAEIRAALGDSAGSACPAVCVVPVRMTEAWLLIDSQAIRRACGNPDGRAVLDLPRLSDVEEIPDPKAVLHELIRTASELTGRRLRGLRVSRCAARVSEFVNDFSPLRSLTAFAALEKDLRGLIRQERWLA